MNRRTWLATTASSLSFVLGGCFQSDRNEGATDSGTGDDPDSDAAADSAESSPADGDTSSEPDAVFWVAEIRDEPPAAIEPVYSSGDDRLEGFEPLAELLERIDAEDDLSPGDRFHSDQVRAGDDRRPALEDHWDEIDGDGDGEVLVEHEDVSLVLVYFEEFAD